MVLKIFKQIFSRPEVPMIEDSLPVQASDGSTTIEPPSMGANHNGQHVDSDPVGTNESFSKSEQSAGEVSDREAVCALSLEEAVEKIKSLEACVAEKEKARANLEADYLREINRATLTRAKQQKIILDHEKAREEFSRLTLARINALEASLQNKEPSPPELKAELQKKEARLQALLAENSKAASEVIYLKAGSDTMQSNIDDLKRQVIELSSTIANQSSSSETLRAERDEAMRRFREASAKADELETRNTLVKTGLEAELRKVKMEKEAANEGHRNAIQRAQTLEIKVETQSEEIRLWTGHLFAHCPLVLKWLAQIEECHHEIEWAQDIVTDGRGPMDEDAFDSLLRRHGYVPYPPCNHDAEVMIVGREEWREQNLQGQIKCRGGKPVKVYSQEMAMIAILTGYDPFDAEQDVLLEMGGGHPCLEFLMSGDFRWPSFRPPISSDPSSPGGEIELRETSPLTHCEYRVGVTSPLTQRERRKILKSIFTREDVFPPHYSESDRRAWGRADSKRRLKRIAEHIVHNISFHSGRLGLSSPAIREWQEDLDWLKKTFYKNEMRFDWPKKNHPPNLPSKIRTVSLIGRLTGHRSS